MTRIKTILFLPLAIFVNGAVLLVRQQERVWLYTSRVSWAGQAGPNPEK